MVAVAESTAAARRVLAALAAYSAKREQTGFTHFRASLADSAAAA